MTMRVSGTAPLTYRVHAVDDGGHWAWILGDRFLAQINRDRCSTARRSPAGPSY